MLLKTDVYTKNLCPRTEKKANVWKDCMSGCIHFLHLSYHAGMPVVCCCWPKHKEHITKKEEKEAAETHDQTQ